MTDRSRTRATSRCPFCASTVRPDRLRAHVRDVHPDRRLEPSADDGRIGPRRSPARRSGAPRSRVPLFGPRGWALVGLGLALTLLVAWALLRAPSAPATAQVGKSAPDFSFTDLGGTPRALSSYEGHPLVVWWIATYCTSCGDGTQHFAQSYASQYSSAGVTMLEVESYNDLGQPGPSLSTFASQYGYAAGPQWVLGSGSSQGTTAYNPDSYLDAYFVLSSGGTVLDAGQNLPASFGAVLQEAQGT